MQRSSSRLQLTQFELFLQIFRKSYNTFKTKDNNLRSFYKCKVPIRKQSNNCRAYKCDKNNQRGNVETQLRTRTCYRAQIRSSQCTRAHLHARTHSTRQQCAHSSTPCAWSPPPCGYFPTLFAHSPIPCALAVTVRALGAAVRALVPTERVLAVPLYAPTSIMCAH